jgi:hypothetical protein
MFNVQMNGVRMISDNDVHTRAHTALVSPSPCIDLSSTLRASVRSCPTPLPVPSEPTAYPPLPVPSEPTASPFGVTDTCQPAWEAAAGAALHSPLWPPSAQCVRWHSAEQYHTYIVQEAHGTYRGERATGELGQSDKEEL